MRAVTPATPVSPEARARECFEAGRYREAIEFYKGLLKQERRCEWVAGLAASYAGRAQELASKGMLPEALVVWRNRSSLCDLPLAEGPYIGWLLRAGEHHAALGLLTTAGDDALTTASDLETRLAAVALTAPDSALAQLAADSPLRRHRDAALAAVAACCRGDSAALDEQLRAIPFRSPYRDLRLILKAILLLGDDRSQAGELIVRVAADGPFEKLAAVVRAGVLPGTRWLSALAGLDDEGRLLLLELKGCPENRRSLVLELAELAHAGVPPAPARIIELLLRRNRSVPATAAKLCRRLLPYADKRLAEYRNAFGPLGAAEGETIMALAAELRRAPEVSERHWLRAVKLLVTRENAPLPAALILRHLFDLIVGDRDASDCDRECTRWLESSLALDPDDRDAHLKLIRIHRQARDPKAARAAMEAALARFATDPVLLLEAVDMAAAGGAFKKAVTLAKRLLELDPINSKVRAVIGQAHLSHARKQIRAGRPDMANKELGLAEEWLAAATERSISKLLRGLSATDATATALLREAAAELGGDLLASFHLVLESVRIGSPTTVVLQRAGVSLSGTPADREVLAVMQAINVLGKPDRRALGIVLDTLRKRLKDAAGGAFSEAERVSICETLLRLDERELLLAHANAGLKRWPERPLFVYLKSFARHGPAAGFAMSAREKAELEHALEQAVADGDQRTVLRIRGLIAPREFCAGDDPDDFSDLDPFDALGESPFENPRALLEMMISLGNEQGLINLAREIVSESEFRQLERAAGGDRKKLARMLIDHLLELEGRRSDGYPSGEAARPAPRAPKASRNKAPVADDRQRGLFDD